MSDMVNHEGGQHEIIEIEEQRKSCMKSEKKKKENNHFTKVGYAMHCNGCFLG
jgi:hypothetical protein